MNKYQNEKQTHTHTYTLTQNQTNQNNELVEWNNKAIQYLKREFNKENIGGKAKIK